MTRYTKISDAGTELPADAADHVAVRDNTTGLTWAAKPIKVKNWKPKTEAMIASKLAASTLAGLTGWRISTVQELFAIADLTRRDPAIDQTFFPDTPSDWFWSSTPYAPCQGDLAWRVGFSGGVAYAYDRDSYGFVRAVRASDGGKQE